jgi:hypothetical protein
MAAWRSDAVSCEPTTAMTKASETLLFSQLVEPFSLLFVLAILPEFGECANT